MDPGRKPVKPGTRPAAQNTAKPAAKPGVKPGASAPAAAPPNTPKGAPPKGPVIKGKTGFKDIMAVPSEENIALLRMAIIIMSMIILVLTLTLTWAKFSIPRDPISFAINTQTGKPKQMRGLSTPTQTQQAIMSWVGSAAADILNFGFHNAAERLDSTRKYFTDDGWKSFSDAVKASGILKRITEKQQVITAAPIGTPVILRTAENPVYGKQWTVQVPISVTVLSGKETDSRKRTLTLILVSVTPDKSLSGLGIDRWLETQ